MIINEIKEGRISYFIGVRESIIFKPFGRHKMTVKIPREDKRTPNQKLRDNLRKHGQKY